MKFQLKHLYIFSIIAVTYFVACDKEDSSEQYPPDAVASCSDGLLNQGEFKVDCGGPCDSCKLFPKMTAFIDSFWIPDTQRGPQTFTASIAWGDFTSGGVRVNGVDTNNGQSITFVHNQAFKRGVYLYDDIDGESWGCDFVDGVVEITAFDTVKSTLSGTFSFNCIGRISGKKERVLDGIFEDIQY